MSTTGRCPPTLATSCRWWEVSFRRPVGSEVGDFSPLSPPPKGWLPALVPAAPAPDSRKWILDLCELLGIGGRGGKRPVTSYPSHVPVPCPMLCPLPRPPAAPAQLSTRVVVPVMNIRVCGVGRKIICAASLVAAGGPASTPRSMGPAPSIVGPRPVALCRWPTLCFPFVC